MKKIISVLTVMVMLCVTTLSVNAAVASPSKNTIAQSGTVVTEDGEILQIDDMEELSKYLIVEDTDEIQAENVSGYLTAAIFEATLKNIRSAEVIIYVPGVKVGDTIIVRKYVKDGSTAKAESKSSSVITASSSETQVKSGVLLCSNEAAAKVYAGKPRVTGYTKTASNTEVNSEKAPTTGGKWVDIDSEIVGDNLIKISLTESTYIEVLKLDTSNKGDNNSGDNNKNPGNNGSGTTTKPGTSTTKPGTTTTKPGTTSSTSTTVKPNTSKKAPKTGEGKAFPVACAVFAGCVAGVVICSTKMRKKTK